MDEHAEKKKINPEKKLHFIQEQYDMLLRCSKKRDVTKWNEWREKKPSIDIVLEGVDFSHAYLVQVHLWDSRLEGSNFSYAHLERADLSFTHLENVQFTNSIVNSETLIRNCIVDRNTDFRGVGLDSIRIDSGTKELLKYNGRRMNWEDWYKNKKWYKQWLVRLFWWMSDYGASTERILGVFFGLAAAFGGIYCICECFHHPVVSFLSQKDGVDVHGLMILIRALYFSIVTMTTLGFGDIFAYPSSLFGHLLLTLQVLLGYALLGALVTRFAVLFSADGPAGTFSKPEKKETEE